MFGRHNDQNDNQQDGSEHHSDVIAPENQAQDQSNPTPAPATDDNWQHPGAPLDNGQQDVPQDGTPAVEEPPQEESYTAPEVAEPAPEAAPVIPIDEHLQLDVPEELVHETPEPAAPAPVFDVSGPAGNFNPPAPAREQPTVEHELIDLKQKALTELSPLVNHLEQAPHERFHTLMMMIQATDDQGLIKEAYEAAEKIEDEKLRAQALLDVVNEINYFTQPRG
jgi:hypothetical protein